MHEATQYADADYQVVEFEGDDPQWMFELLSNPSFARVPPYHLQGLLERFHPMEVVAGQVAVRQGNPGDYFYLIRKGRAQVTRQGSSGMSVVLAELGPGACFGEEALISGNVRNATVTMIEPGLLMRLAAQDFDALLRMPLIHGLTMAVAKEMLDKGALLLDVRTREEYLQGSLPGAINLPLILLRLKSSKLDRQHPLILFCDDGKKSASAAFLLAQSGFETHVLIDGLAEFRKSGGWPTG